MKLIWFGVYWTYQVCQIFRNWFRATSTWSCSRCTWVDPGLTSPTAAYYSSTHPLYSAPNTNAAPTDCYCSGCCCFVRWNYFVPRLTPQLHLPSLLTYSLGVPRLHLPLTCHHYYLSCYVRWSCFQAARLFLYDCGKPSFQGTFQRIACAGLQSPYSPHCYSIRHQNGLKWV